jgi:hypothetical protein
LGHIAKGGKTAGYDITSNKHHFLKPHFAASVMWIREAGGDELKKLRAAPMRAAPIGGHNAQNISRLCNGGTDCRSHRDVAEICADHDRSGDSRESSTVKQRDFPV